MLLDWNNVCATPTWNTASVTKQREGAVLSAEEAWESIILFCFWSYVQICHCPKQEKEKNTGFNSFLWIWRKA